jgi:TPR repeat protein
MEDELILPFLEELTRSSLEGLSPPPLSLEAAQTDPDFVAQAFAKARLGDPEAQRLSVALTLLGAGQAGSDYEVRLWSQGLAQHAPIDRALAGLVLDRGVGGTSDAKAARDALLSAAKLGIAFARDYAVAQLPSAAWSKLAAVPDNSWLDLVDDSMDSSALFTLASAFELGLGVQVSADRAFELYSLASDRGSAMASLRLGSALMGGQLGRCPDLSAAARFVALGEQQMRMPASR